MSRQGLLIILSSPSGAGKSTLAKRLRAFDASIRFSVSATTRPPRPGEVEGTDYFFKSEDDFRDLIENNALLEWAEVFGNSYGTPVAPIEAAIADGQDVIFDVDWQGGQQIRASHLHDAVISIFILPPSLAELEARLVKRGQDSAEVVDRRMAKSRDEISHWQEYDYVLINDDLETCFQDLVTILKAERLRRNRQTGLMQFVKDLTQKPKE